QPRLDRRRRLPGPRDQGAAHGGPHGQRARHHAQPGRGAGRCRSQPADGARRRPRPERRRGPGARRRGAPLVVAYDRKDALYRRAKREGYRSRAAYKLEELQRTQRVLRRGQRVVDLGCWPGGWLQVAAAAVGPEGRVVGVDVAETEPLGLANVIAFRGDLGDPGLTDRILEALGGSAHVVLSDAAPKLTGVRATDRAREEALLEAIEALLP